MRVHALFVSGGHLLTNVPKDAYADSNILLASARTTGLMLSGARGSICWNGLEIPQDDVSASMRNQLKTR